MRHHCEAPFCAQHGAKNQAINEVAVLQTLQVVQRMRSARKPLAMELSRYLLFLM
jgi:hypothetical protein